MERSKISFNTLIDTIVYLRKVQIINWAQTPLQLGIVENDFRIIDNRANALKSSYALFCENNYIKALFLLGIDKVILLKW